VTNVNYALKRAGQVRRVSRIFFIQVFVTQSKNFFRISSHFQKREKVLLIGFAWPTTHDEVHLWLYGHLMIGKYGVRIPMFQSQPFPLCQRMLLCDMLHISSPWKKPWYGIN